MKLQILPPARVKAKGLYCILDSELFVSAWGIVIEVAANYRYHRAIAGETQRDLLRFCAVNSLPIRAGLADGRAPFFYFERSVAETWLEQGGRAWIISELEARSSRRVVAFPSRGGEQ